MKRFVEKLLKHILGLALVLMLVSSSFAADFSDWESNPAALSGMLDSAKADKKPVIVYFHADWCGWCKKFNETYLPSSEVTEYLGKFDKIQLLENNSSEFKTVKREYRVNGYPAFFIIVPAIDDRGVKMSPFLESGTVSPEAYVKLMERTVRGIYAKHGVFLLQQKLYLDAVEYFQLAITHAGEDAKIRCAMGTSYYYQAYTEKNEELLDEAETQYKLALELQADYPECQKNYNSLLKTKASIR